MKIDIASDTWATIKQACTEAIDLERGALGDLSCTEKRADQARGAMHAYGQILLLAEPPPSTAVQFDAASKRRDRAGF